MGETQPLEPKGFIRIIILFESPNRKVIDFLLGKVRFSTFKVCLFYPHFRTKYSFTIHYFLLSQSWGSKKMFRLTWGETQPLEPKGFICIMSFESPNRRVIEFLLS